MTNLAKAIEKHAKPVDKRHQEHLPVSPERSTAIFRMFKRSDAYADISDADVFSPFKPRQQSGAVFASTEAVLTTLVPERKQTAAPVLMETSVGSELEIVSLSEETTEQASWSEEGGLMKVTEGPYTVYGEMPERLKEGSSINQ